MYRVAWWNANGEPQISNEMSKAQAEIFKASMLPEQEARLVYINVR